jgi:hypothetical protein
MSNASLQTHFSVLGQKWQSPPLMLVVSQPANQTNVCAGWPDRSKCVRTELEEPLWLAFLDRGYISGAPLPHPHTPPISNFMKHLDNTVIEVFGQPLLMVLLTYRENDRDATTTFLESSSVHCFLTLSLSRRSAAPSRSRMYRKSYFHFQMVNFISFCETSENSILSPTRELC